MFVNLFNRSYQIEITSKPLIRDGKPLDAMLQRASMRVFLSHSLSPAERRKALIHELRHVWTQQMGLPANEESDAREVSEFVDAILEQLEAQGGNQKLMALSPVSQSYGPNEYRGFAPVSRHECKLCGAVTMSGSVSQCEPKLHPVYGQHFVERRFECEACGTVNAWSEFSSEQGSPLGSPVPGVEYQAT